MVDGIDDHRLKLLSNELSKCPVGGIHTSAGPGALSHRLELYLTSLRFTENIVSTLSKMLQVNKSLTHLDLSDNSKFSDSGARCIFEGLQHNTTLVNLNLSHTGIATSDPDTARSLMKMLQVNKSLTHLDLSKNKLSDLGDYSIFEGLQYNTTLVNLNLSHTGTMVLSPDTALSLTKMLQEKKSLKHLDLSHTLRYLDLLGVTFITDSTAEHIAEALEFNCTLQTLDISECLFLGQNGIDLILESLMFNSTLQTLCISMYVIDSETLSTFKRTREIMNLPPIDIVMNDSYLTAETDFSYTMMLSNRLCFSEKQSTSMKPSSLVKSSPSVKTPSSVTPSTSNSSAAHSSSDESIDIDSSSLPSPSASDSIISQLQPNSGQDEITSVCRSKKDWKKIREFLKCNNSTLLHIVDIGGQPDFHEILPLLLHGHALNLIVLNMTQDLDSPYTVVYRDDSGSCPIQYKSEFTIYYQRDHPTCPSQYLITPIKYRSQPVSNYSYWHST